MANSRVCSIPDCGKPYCARGYCSNHYKSIIQKDYKPPTRPCAIHGCKNVARGRHYCLRHYKRLYKYGDPLAGSTEWGAAQAHLEELVDLAKTDECVPWPYSCSPQGQGQIRVNGKLLLVARIVCERRHGPPPTPKHQAAHSCGKGHEGCANWNHLSWKTQKENEADKIGHGTARGYGNSRGVKLYPAEVREIRRLRDLGIQGPVIGRIFGIQRQTVYAISARRLWPRL